jgi:DNA-binding GntR family transcriptional regulator
MAIDLQSSEKQATETVVESAIRTIRDAIHGGRFAPGEHLVVADLQQMLGISAGPVREAIRRLAGEGLLDVVPHRGAMVRQFSERDVRDYFQLREAIEGATARFAADNIRHPGYAARLKDIAVALRQATSDRSNTRSEKLADARQAFHDCLYDMTGNQRLAEVARQLTYPTFARRYHLLMTRRDADSLREHEDIIEMILAGNGQMAERLMRQHLRNSEAAIRDAIDDDPYFAKAFFGNSH